MDRFEAQEAAIHKFRAFASEANVHVTLVIHPRKERDGETLAMHSVFGSAKATQEADTVLILQNVNGSKAVDVRKNRFDGGTGSVPLVFDPAAMMYREKGSEPIKGGIASLLSARDVDGDTLAGSRTLGSAAAVSAAGARAALQALGLVAADLAGETAAPPGTHAHVAAMASAAQPVSETSAAEAPAAEAHATGAQLAEPSASELTTAADAEEGACTAPQPARTEPEAPAEPAAESKPAAPEARHEQRRPSAATGEACLAAPAAGVAPPAHVPGQGPAKRQLKRAVVPGAPYAVAGALPAVRRSQQHSAATPIVDGDDDDLALSEPDETNADATTEWPEDDILTG